MFFTSCSSKRRIFSRQAEIRIENFSTHDDTNFYLCDKAGLKFTYEPLEYLADIHGNISITAMHTQMMLPSYERMHESKKNNSAL